MSLTDEQAAVANHPGGHALVSAVAGLAWGLVIVGIVLLIGKAFGRNLSFSEGHAAPKA